MKHLVLFFSVLFSLVMFSSCGDDPLNEVEIDYTDYPKPKTYRIENADGTVSYISEREYKQIQEELKHDSIIKAEYALLKANLDELDSRVGKWVDALNIVSHTTITTDPYAKQLLEYGTYQDAYKHVTDKIGRYLWDNYPDICKYELSDDKRIMYYYVGDKTFRLPFPTAVKATPVQWGRVDQFYCY